MRPEAEHSIVFIVDRLIFFHPKITLLNLQRAEFEFLEDTLQKSIKQKNRNRKKNRRKKRKCKESSLGNFLAMVNPVFFARPLFSKSFLPRGALMCHVFNLNQSKMEKIYWGTTMKSANQPSSIADILYANKRLNVFCP